MVLWMRLVGLVSLNGGIVVRLCSAVVLDKTTGCHQRSLIN